MNKLVISLSIVLGVAALCFVAIGAITIHSHNPAHQPDTPLFQPYQAAFAVYTNGTLRQFSGTMYLNQSEDVFIEASNPAIVQVKKPNITWQQFFDTLPISLTPTCLTTGTGQTFCSNQTTALRFFLNGTENPQLLQHVMKPKDRVLISYGITTAEEVLQQYKRVPTP